MLNKLNFSKCNKIISELSKSESESRKSIPKASPVLQSFTPIPSQSAGNLFSLQPKSKRSEIPVHISRANLNLSPTGILSQLDLYKYKWLEMKSNRLTEERNHEIGAGRTRNGKQRLESFAKQNTYRSKSKKFGAIRIPEDEYNKNRNGLSKEELETLDLYFRKRFGIFDKRYEKNRRFQETLKHYAIKKDLINSKTNESNINTNVSPITINI